MLNTQIADTILQMYGKDALVIYCKIQSMISHKMDEELGENHEPSDYDYDAQWWNNKYEELKNESI